MSDDEVDDGRAGARNRFGAPPPARPRMSDTTPPPIPVRLSPPKTLRTARALWWLSFAIGLTAIAFAIVARMAQFDRLRDVVVELAPDQTDDTIDAVTTALFWGTLIALAVVIAIEAVLVTVMLRRHGAARWLLLAFLFVHAAVALIADGFVGRDDEGLLVRIVLTAQLASAGVALVFGLVPRSGRWFRAKREAKPVVGS